MSANYQAYLLRIRRSQTGAPWRFTLQHPQSGEQHHFSELAQLVQFLERFGRTNDPKNPQPT